MRVCQDFTVKFDDPNLVSCAGLGPVLQLAARAGLQDWSGSTFGSTRPAAATPT